MARPRALDVLRSGRGRRLTLVCAPAGYGKTTVLAQWRAKDGPRLPFAWVSLDRDDRDPIRMWTYVTTALAEAEPSLGRESLPALRRARNGPTLLALPLLLGELEALKRDIVLVLDDYHLAQSDGVNESVEFFIRFPPRRLQVVIASRFDPDLPIDHLRACEELVELRADGLRLDSREAAAFLRGAGLHRLSRTDVARLVDRTEGWPAMLRLAALLLPRSADRREFIRTFGGDQRQIVDYVTTDVLETVPDRTRAFLLETSVLERLNASLCNAVTQRRDSAAILAELDRTNFFLVPLDCHGSRYRHHQLFAEALRLELERSRPDVVPLLHARASAWYERDGDAESAIEHAIAAHDAARAGALIADQVSAVVSAGSRPPIRRWLSSLTWPEALEVPELAVARALVAGMDGHLREAEEWLDVADRGSAGQASETPAAFLVSWLRSFFGVGDLGEALRAANRAVERAPTPTWEGAALAELGQALYLLGRAEEALPALRRAMTLVPDLNPLILAQAAGYLALSECDLGNVDHAEQVIRPVLDLLASVGASRAPLAGICHMAAGAVVGARGYLAGAEEELDLAVELRRGDGPNAWCAHALLLLSAVRHAAGRRPEAREALVEAEKMLDRLPDPGVLGGLAERRRRELARPTRRPVSFGEALSEREVSVLRLAAVGLTQREIAQELFVSHNTVKSHVRTIYRKLGARSRTEAVRLAEQHGAL